MHFCHQVKTVWVLTLLAFDHQVFVIFVPFESRQQFDREGIRPDNSPSAMGEFSRDVGMGFSDGSNPRVDRTGNAVPRPYF
jgi:hypothetical protein